MNSTILKTEALAWLRFVKKMDLICTEGGPWNSDVIGCTETMSVEVETKISRADLLAEFRKKTTKHAYYETGERWCPNFFYFLVPEELGPSTVETVTEKMPKAGVLIYKPDMWPGLKDRLLIGRRLIVLKSAQRLRKHKPTEKFKRQLMLRMGSELASLHAVTNSLREISEVEAIKTAIVDALVSTQGLAEWEKEPDEANPNE
jgi:hypothetical protein